MIEVDLKSRWLPEIVEEINREIEKTGKDVIRGSRLPRSPFGTLPDGFEDYRCFVLKKALRYSKLSNVDFSGMVCELSGAFIYCTVRDCTLDGIVVPGRYFGDIVTSCSLRGATLRDSPLGKSFEDCDFSNANLQKATASEATFKRCSFVNADLRRAMLMYCKFYHCRFDGARFHNGSLSRSVFNDGAPTLEQLGNTIIDRVSF